MSEKMLEMGMLTDEDGNKLTDISQIDFAKPIADKFEELILKMSELIDTLIGPESVKAALIEAGHEVRNLPDGSIDVKVNFEKGKIPEWADPNFDWESSETFARGSGGFRDFGRGTPAILHGREAVVPESQAGAFAQQVLGGGSDDVLVDEVAGLRREIQNLPLHIRDAILLAR